MGTHPIFESDFDCLTEWPFHEFSLICPSVAHPPVKLSWNFARTSFPEPPRTSELSAPARRVSATKDRPSTESSPSSCARAAISRTTTVLVANRSMETNSRTRTSRSSTLDLVFSLWLTLVPTPTVLSSSCAPSRLRGSTISTFVFGSVVEGMDIVKKIESVGSQSGACRSKVVIADCGECKSVTHLGVQHSQDS